MTDEKVGVLTVRGRAGKSALGPVGVEVIPEQGNSIEFALTASNPENAVSVRAGRYAIIGRSSTGERFRKSVTVEAGGMAYVDLTEGGSAPALKIRDVDDNVRSRVRSEDKSEGWGGYIENTLRAVNVSRRSSDLTLGITGGARLTLRIWPHRAKRNQAGPAPHPEFGLSVLKIEIDPSYMAVGLLDEHGFGPIVMTPSFTGSFSISFLSEGVASRAAARYLNPSGQRTPVALATPSIPQIADLLAALAAPEVEQATAVWEQNFTSLSNVNEAMDILLHKYERPSEALLGAHFLLRFFPDKLPLKWADNLIEAAPEVSDGPVIAAWLRITANSDDVRALSPARVDRDVQNLITEALNRPLTLFARTRFLLAELLRFQPRLLTSVLQSTQGWTRYFTPGSSSQPDRLLPLEFLNYGAYAGGLEAFWGTDPQHPGPASISKEVALPSIDAAQIYIRGDAFIESESLRLSSSPISGSALASRSGGSETGA